MTTLPASQALRVTLGISLADTAITVGLCRPHPGGISTTDVLVDCAPAQDGKTLLLTVDKLLRSCGCGLADLAVVAFSAGPGPFTRVRVACAAAQGIGLSRGLPVVPVDSLAIQALAAMRVNRASGRAADDAFDDAVVVADARMGDLYVAHFRLDADVLSVPETGRLIKVGSLGVWLDGSNVSPGALFTGDAFLRDPQTLRAQGIPAAGSRVVQPGSEQLMSALLELSRGGPWLAAAEAAPRYVRDKVALDVDEQAALRNRNAANPVRVG